MYAFPVGISQHSGNIRLCTLHGQSLRFLTKQLVHPIFFHYFKSTGRCRIRKDPEGGFFFFQRYSVENPSTKHLFKAVESHRKGLVAKFTERRNGVLVSARSD